MWWIDLGVVLEPGGAERLSRFWEGLKAVCAALYALVTQQMYGPGPCACLSLYALFVLYDFVTGVFAALITRKAQSGIALTGILRKLLGFVAVAVGHAIDRHLGLGNDLVRDTVAKMLIGYEILSIGENLAVSGIVLPDWIRSLAGRAAPPPGPGSGRNEQNGDGPGNRRR